MPDTFTTNLNLTKPEVGASADTWGTKLNADLDSIDALFTTGPVLQLASGGTGAATAANARTNLGLGSIATQAANAVAITGGTIDGVSQMRATGAAPLVQWQESDADTDAKNWQMAPVDGTMQFRAFNDALNASTGIIDWPRSGGTVSSMNVLVPLQVSGATVWHETNMGAGTGLDADLLDGQEGAFYRNASNLNAGSIPNARVPLAAVSQHQASLVIAETQITGGTLLARVGSAETITGQWSFTARPKATGAGGFLSNALAANAGGRITLSDTEPANAAAIGSPGDMVFEY